MTKIKLAPGLVFTITLSLVCQACFGWIGFNPTDEGFILEGSTRILNGQIPHLDFISIRPALSYYLHTPEIWLGGHYTFYLARWVAWLQMAAIAWWWTTLLTRNLQASVFHLYILAGIALCFSAHTFPLTAIHTIDGLFLGTLAIYLAGKREWLWAGLFAGLAGLCKQNYILLLPILAITYRNHWIKLLIPGLTAIGIYILVFFHFAGSNIFLQLSSQSGFIGAALLPFVTSTGWITGIMAGIIVFFSKRDIPVTGLVVLLIAAAGLSSNHYIGQVSFGIFGVACGVSLRKHSPSAILCIVLSWLAAVSVGYNTPAIMSGVLIVLILVETKTYTLPKFTIPAIGLISWGAFTLARLIYPYRDASFTACTYPVGEVLQTGKGIFTNINTYNTLRELDSLSRSLPALVPLPDYCCYWVGKRICSPVPSLWPNKTETKSPFIIHTINHTLSSTELENQWAVQKYFTAELSTGFNPIPLSNTYPVVDIIRHNFHKADSTNYFIVYK